MDLDPCTCNVKLATPKESLAIVTKGVELGEGEGLRYMLVSLAAATAVPMGETPQVGGIGGVNAFG